MSDGLKNFLEKGAEALGQIGEQAKDFMDKNLSEEQRAKLEEMAKNAKDKASEFGEKAKEMAQTATEKAKETAAAASEKASAAASAAADTAKEATTKAKDSGLSLESLNERVESMESKLDQILSKLG